LKVACLQNDASGHRYCSGLRRLCIRYGAQKVDWFSE
jgi:hypothetical protein